MRPKKEKIKELKAQDKKLESLPSMTKEKRVFSKGESALKRLSRSSKIRLNLKQFLEAKRKNVRRIKSRAGRKRLRRKSGKDS